MDIEKTVEVVRLRREVELLRAVISHAIDMLDGNDDEAPSREVAGSELVHKLTEHLDYFHEIEQQSRSAP